MTFKFYFLIEGKHKTKLISAKNMSEAKKYFHDLFEYNAFVYNIRECEGL